MTEADYMRTLRGLAKFLRQLAVDSDKRADKQLKIAEQQRENLEFSRENLTLQYAITKANATAETRTEMQEALQRMDALPDGELEKVRAKVVSGLSRSMTSKKPNPESEVTAEDIEW